MRSTLIDTIISKTQQLKNGYFKSGSGPTDVLVLGSCRIIPYVTYLGEWNNGEGRNQLTIRRIDPRDYDTSVTADVLAALGSTSIFIHEPLTDPVYRSCMNPRQEITVPNWHEQRVLENDWTDYGQIVPVDYIEQGEAAIKEFCALCDSSSFPEFGKLFRNTWLSVRYFWRPSYVSAEFTKAIFRSMNGRFLHFPIERITDYDAYSDPRRRVTSVTQRDRDGYGITWR